MTRTPLGRAFYSPLVRYGVCVLLYIADRRHKRNLPFLFPSTLSQPASDLHAWSGRTSETPCYLHTVHIPLFAKSCSPRGIPTLDSLTLPKPRVRWCARQSKRRGGTYSSGCQNKVSHPRRKAHVCGENDELYYAIGVARRIADPSLKQSVAPHTYIGIRKVPPIGHPLPSSLPQ